MPFPATRSTQSVGIRRYDAGRDLGQVAALVSEAFESELDSESRFALRQLRVWGRFFDSVGMSALGPSGAFSLQDGFVWEDESRVTGNISLQRLDSYGNCWQIANMAVAKSHQRRGIARKLLNRATEYLRDMGCDYAVLQVREDNQIARTLYERHGFERMGGIAELRGVTPLQRQKPPDQRATRAIPGREWRQIYQLAQGQMEHHLKWWRPLKRGDFVHDWPQSLTEGFARLFGLGDTRRFGVRTRAGQFAAAAIVESRFLQCRHNVSIWTRPQLYGMYEHDLIDSTLSALSGRHGMLVQAKVDADHRQALDRLNAWGLGSKSVLQTMRFRVS